MCKYTKKIRSSQPAIPYTELSKTQLFPVSIVKEAVRIGLNNVLQQFLHFEYDELSYMIGKKKVVIEFNQTCRTFEMRVFAINYLTNSQKCIYGKNFLNRRSNQCKTFFPIRYA